MPFDHRQNLPPVVRISLLSSTLTRIVFCKCSYRGTRSIAISSFNSIAYLDCGALFPLRIRIHRPVPNALVGLAEALADRSGSVSVPKLQCSCMAAIEAVPTGKSALLSGGYRSLSRLLIHTPLVPDVKTSPACPECQSARTELLEFMTHRPFHVYRCLQCEHIWRELAEPPKPTRTPKK
jgi:hypothetical protein